MLQVRLGGEPVVVLAAELVSETAGGAFALQLAALDPSHLPELMTIAEGDESALASIAGPMSASASSVFGRKTLPDPEPELVEDDDLQASVLFDPEAAMISRAPPRPAGTEEDTLTIPARASMMPPAAVPPSARPPQPHASRAPGEPNTISHFSFPSLPPVTERLEPPAREGSSPDLSINIVVDFDTSQSLVSTERWSGSDGAGAPDPSLGPSVVFDPDVLARDHRSRVDPEQSSQRMSVGGGGPRTMRRITGGHGIVIVGRVIANRYRIDSLLGAGAVGAV